ncbi:lipoprotein [Streptomyces viridochromogenes]|uniref:Lipoprotein n=1 Tax=Streptomyces viridochromogenes TaxID=1938 RepID=A0A0J7ZMM8_STRVR|nr:hypothetical protein [Streptomyces viridochromogenes]KMS76358.1 lipoprotein [Streptomyces viridochromogenes]KOG20471.1 lipoprotein [Streptomyces viridochromogenes]KOG22314.1 lipoprotein [Streptomyces viridochromogenes]
MRAIRVTSAALLGVTALAMTAPAAGAHEDDSGFWARVVPTTVAPGGQVTLRATGCEQTVTVASAVFDTVTIRRGHTTARATVDRDARPGAVYEVSFYCGTFWQNVDLTIAGGRPAPVRPAHPQKGVHAGDGGSFAELNLKELGVGAALITGALGTAYHLSRRGTEENDA